MRSRSSALLMMLVVVLAASTTSQAAILFRGGFETPNYVSIAADDNGSALASVADFATKVSSRSAAVLRSTLPETMFTTVAAAPATQPFDHPSTMPTADVDSNFKNYDLTAAGPTTRQSYSPDPNFIDAVSGTSMFINAPGVDDVPEPSSALLGLLAIAPMMATRRRRA